MRLARALAYELDESSSEEMRATGAALTVLYHLVQGNPANRDVVVAEGYIAMANSLLQRLTHLPYLGCPVLLILLQRMRYDHKVIRKNVNFGQTYSS